MSLCILLDRQITVAEFRDALGSLVSGLTHEELKLLAAHFDMDGEVVVASAEGVELTCMLSVQLMAKLATPNL
jgi:hypothetical protein